MLTGGGNLSFPAAWLAMIRKIFAILALTSLLLAGVPALAESLSASHLPNCCTTAFCPLHHRQARDLERDKNLCDSAGHHAGDNCSLRACDTPANPVMGTVVFVLSAPAAIPVQTHAESAPVQASSFFPYALNLPSTPPPRALLA
jgi:hypothetical protein